MIKLYYLEGREPKLANDFFHWSEKMDGRLPIIAQTYIGSVLVSTVFTGVPYYNDNSDRPLLFETAIYGGTYSNTKSMSDSYYNAEIAHEAACELVIIDSLPFQ